VLNINQTKKISGELKSDVFFCEQIDGPISMGVISGGGRGGTYKHLFMLFFRVTPGMILRQSAE